MPVVQASWVTESKNDPVLGFPSTRHAVFSTEVVASCEEAGRGDEPGPSSAAPRHRAACGVITQLQLFKYIDMPCYVADRHWPQAPFLTASPEPSRVSVPYSLRKDTAEPPSFSPLILFLSVLPNLIWGSADVSAWSLCTSQCLVVVACCKMLLFSQLSHDL